MVSRALSTERLIALLSFAALAAGATMTEPPAQIVWVLVLLPLAVWRHYKVATYRCRNCGEPFAIPRNEQLGLTIFFRAWFGRECVRCGKLPSHRE